MPCASFVSLRLLRRPCRSGTALYATVNMALQTDSARLHIARGFHASVDGSARAAAYSKTARARNLANNHQRFFNLRIAGDRHFGAVYFR